MLKSRSLRSATWLTAAAVGLFSVVGLVTISRADSPAAGTYVAAGFKISGTVLDSAGKPVANAQVRLLQKRSLSSGATMKDPNANPAGGSVIGVPDPSMLQKGGAGAGRGERVVSQTKTDASGKFLFPDVAKGKYAVQAGLGKETARQEFEITSSDPAPMNLKLSAN